MIRLRFLETEQTARVHASSQGCESIDCLTILSPTASKRRKMPARTRDLPAVRQQAEDKEVGEISIAQ